MELEEEYCSAFGFEVCEANNTSLYRDGTMIPKKPKFYDSPRKKMIRKHIKRLNQNVRRLNNKVANMKELVQLLRKKNLASEEQCDQLQHIFMGDSAKIFENQARNSKKSIKGRRYCDEVKRFALTLHYYSPKAYVFCR